MKRIIKKIGLIGGAIFLFLILVLIIASLLFYYNKSLTRNIIQKLATDKSGFKIEIGKLGYGFFPLDVHASAVRISQETKGKQVEILIKGLKARGGLKRLLKQRKPIFESVEIEGGDFRINQEVTGKTDLREMISQLNEALGYVKKITLKDIALNLTFQSQNIALQKANLTLSKSPQEGTYAFNLDCGAFGAKREDGNIGIETELALSGTFSLLDKVIIDGNLLLSHFHLATPWLEDTLSAISIKLNGEFRLDERVMAIPQWTMGIPNLGSASGALEVSLNKDFILHIRSKIVLEDLEYGLNYLKPFIPHKFGNLGFKGKAGVEGNYNYAKNPQGKKDNLEVFLKLEPTRVQYSAPNRFSLQTLVSGTFTLSGPLSDIQIAGEIQSQKGNLATKNLELRNVSFHFPFQAKKNLAQFGNFKSAVRYLGLAFGRHSLAFENVEIKGSGRFKIPQRSLYLDFLEAHLPGLPPLQSSARIDLSPRGEKYLKLRSSGIKLEMVRNLFPDFMPKNLEGWEFDSNCGFEAEVKNSPHKKNEWEFSLQLDLSEGKFQDSSLAIAGEALQPRIKLKGKYDLFKKKVLLSGTFSLAQGESLWNDFYINWSKNPVNVGFAGVYSIPSNQLDEISLSASMPTLGEIQAQGMANIQAPFSLKLEADSRLNLASLYSLISNGQTDDKGQMNIKGEAKTRMNLERTKDTLSMEGDFELSDGAMENQNAGFYIQGLQAKVPFCFVMGSGAKKSEEVPALEKGYFRAKEFRISLITISPLELSIQGLENSFQIEPFSFSLFGGAAELGKTSFSFEPQTLSFNGNSSLRLKDIDFSQLPLKSEQFNLKGSAQANLLQIEIDRQKLTAQGQGKVDIFGGKATIQNISMANPFSRGRTLTFDVDFKNIDLEKLTNTVPFGRVTGIINGEIKDLAISYGQPESFDLKLESVKKKGVSQKFSLKAVNNLSVLSSGEKAALPSSKWWMRFVSGFRYEKIGIWSTLKNDMFTLRGTVVENGVEYLVRRSRFFGIDVINREPEKEVSFKEMIQRLNRIGKSNPKFPIEN
jgi:hypothetical protein